MKICLGKLGETASRDSLSSPYSNPQEFSLSQAKRQTQQITSSADKTDNGNSATIRDIVCTSMPTIPESTEKVVLTDEEASTGTCSVSPNTTDKLEREHKIEREVKTISGERYDAGGYLDLDLTETTSHKYLQKWIKDIYSVEHKAKQARIEGKGEEMPQVGHRRVLKVKNSQEAKQADIFYSNADGHKIVFSDEESLCQ